MGASFLKQGVILKELRFPNFFTGVSILLFLGNFGIIMPILPLNLSLLGFPPYNFDPLKSKHSSVRGDWYPWLMQNKLFSSHKDVGSSLLPQPLDPRYRGPFYILIFVECFLNPALLVGNILHFIALSAHSGLFSRELSKSVVST